MKKFLPIILLSISFYSFGQKMPAIKNLYAYYYVPLPGIVSVDPDGIARKVKRDTVYRVFVEVNGKAPQWKSAVAGGKTFSVLAKAQKNFPLKVGDAIADGKAVTIRPAKGNSLWEIEFGEQTAESKDKSKTKTGQVVLTGVFKNTSFCKTVRPVEIASPLYQ